MTSQRRSTAFLAGVLLAASVYASCRSTPAHPRDDAPRPSRAPAPLRSGFGQQAGPLYFDPQGADFAPWINHFKNEVYRYWNVPQDARAGVSGAVEIEFVVERDGRLSNLRILKPSGTVSLDRAAEDALRGARFLPLPADFGPARVPMRVVFFYNTAPSRAS